MGGILFAVGVFAALGAIGLNDSGAASILILGVFFGSSLWWLILSAAAGSVDRALLAQLLDDPYFRAAPPKSTGRERFGAPFVSRIRARLDALSFDDAVATLTALTVHSLAGAVRRHAPDAAIAIVSGGGAHNLTILAGLRAELPGVRVERSDAFGIDPDAKEAIAFAILGRETLRERAAGLPRVTGARGPRVLGAIAPAGLGELLARVRGEESER